MDPLVIALAQLVRDRWTNEQRTHALDGAASAPSLGPVVKRLPATIEDLAGRRAARWIRESTPGQFDRYGPEAQAELQDRAIVKLGLVDSGFAWRAAHSGRTVYRSAR